MRGSLQCPIIDFDKVKDQYSDMVLFWIHLIFLESQNENPHIAREILIHHRFLSANVHFKGVGGIAQKSTLCRLVMMEIMNDP